MHHVNRTIACFASLCVQLVVALIQIFGGPGCNLQWIHYSMKPTTKYIEAVHWMITQFSLFTAQTPC